MYTSEMATAFKAITPPNNFGVVILENENFLTIQIDPRDLTTLLDKDKPTVVEYINNVKKTLEDHGAVVMILREAIEE
jgi:hypothetical protein